MLLGSARVSKGAEQHKAGAHLVRQLPSVDAMFGIAKRLVLKDGSFVEQIREVEAFVSLNPVNTLLQPVDVQGTDGR
jgi:hypothetical protein